MRDSLYVYVEHQREVKSAARSACKQTHGRRNKRPNLSIVDNAPSGMVVTRPDGLQMYIPPERLTKQGKVRKGYRKIVRAFLELEG